MLTLAVDTAADFGGIALATESGVLEETLLHAPRGFSHILFAEIEALLARHSVRLSDIELYAAASGPGSFTGVRVGLAAIKGLAVVAGKPAVGVSNLDAIAEFGTSDFRAPVVDAKRGEVYAALLDVRSRKHIVPEMVLPFPGFLTLAGAASATNVEWISSAFDAYLPMLSGTPFEGSLVTAAPLNLAGVMARIAIRRHQAGEVCDPASIEANYVRRSDAEIFWKDS
jgi:tRNA threonylcarbamoyladenosine biosynthesis protein TsaB